MTRARATALALVNWKGVFYERYLLDRHVTVLEGANGAGKTTVMIAAYVVLLPDMSRLRFTNLGETGATGGDRGIWGRLGESGRPSYTAMEIEVGDERVIAGVRLERKAEPTIELTPFLATGLDLAGHLKEILLATDGEHDAVPDMSELRAAVTARGGELTVFASAKDYFASLFERGINPLRLATEEERNKMNEMLRTSMTGGISRALTTELRSFLLKEETGLADTLSRMRKNLDTCQRTRTEVAESRSLEREIAGVFDAGQSMFTAALVAVRDTAREQGAIAEAARAKRDETAREVRNVDRTLADGKARHASTEARLAAARLARDEAIAHKDKVARAWTSLQKLAELEPLLEAARALTEDALEQREDRRAAKDALKADRDRAREAYDRAAYGVGNLQSGLDELHKNVHARRLVVRRLSEARDILGDPSLDEAGLDGALDAARARLAQVDAERARAHRDLSFSAEQQGQYERAYAALVRLDPRASPALAFEHATSVAQRFVELESLLKRVPELSSSLGRHAAMQARQSAVRGRANDLGLELAALRATGEPAAASIGRQLEDAEAEARGAELDVHAHEKRAGQAQRLATDARARVARLEGSSARWSACRAGAEEIAAAIATPIASREDAALARMRVAELRERQRATVAELRARQERRLQEAGELEAAGGVFHPDLIRIRDELDAELLAGRFEELAPEDAAELEAELGPLAHALIVDDPVSAARALAGTPREMADLWLVRPDAALLQRAPKAAAPGTDVVVEEAYGVRLTKMPDRPSIGRVARERRAAEMRAEADLLGQELDQALSRLYEYDAMAERADALVADAELLDTEDPSVALERARAEAEAHDTEEGACHQAMDASAARATALRAKAGALRNILGEAFLLDPPDHAKEAVDLEGLLSKARSAQEELRRTEEDRRVLRELEGALRSPPPTPEALAQARSQTAALDEARDRQFALIEALEHLVDHRAAIRGDDAERTLEEQSAIAPALQAQLEAARRALATEEEALARGEAAWEEASAAWQRAQGAWETLRQQVEQLRKDVVAQGLAELPEDAIAMAERAVLALDHERLALERDERAIATEIALLDERLARAKSAALAAEGALADRERDARPAHAAWVDVEATAGAHGLLKRALPDQDLDRPSGSSAARWAEAQSKAQVLIERMRRSRGGLEDAEEIERALSIGDGRSRKDPTDIPASAYVSAWLTTREWLKRRLPGQIAEVADPLEALVRLRDHLALLEGRLTRQETDLRGTSEDVARGIDVRLRRAKAQVRRLNQSLRGVHFGNIAGIRVEMRRVERMDAVLRALREGAAQELLFLSTLPIEEALDEIFRRYGGGKTGGQRILDYREYAELAVEIQRNASATASAPNTEKAWETASPTRLSTGEAIGVGAALMMVVLTEWERDGNLLRPQKPIGSLRFLFLDEANRLSQDNLGVLFALCSNLDLQLLIAAPEVARAEGNTTYRLVRKVGEDGREEVLVSGRRTVA